MSAEAVAPTPQASADANTGAKKKSKWWLWLLLVLIAAGGGAAWYVLVKMPAQAAMALESDDAEATPAPTLYFELRPAFVANLAGNRFLQIEIDLMSNEQAAIDAIKRHSPVIRNELLLLLGSQKPADLQTLEGKKALQQEVLESINAVLSQREGDLQIAEIYFTSFVMQ